MTGQLYITRLIVPNVNLVIFMILSNEKEWPGIETRPPYNLNKKKGQI